MNKNILSKEPLISIIVPVYNAEKYLDECVKSILSQTYKNIELILVNDGSTDNSLNICLNYKDIDNRVVVFDKINSGVSETRNLGLDNAHGEYIGFVDSDDFVDIDMYKTLVNIILSEKSDLCALISYTCKKNKLKNVQQLAPEMALQELIFLRFPTSVWAYLYSKHILTNIKFYDDIHVFEDFVFNFEVLLKANAISISKEKLYFYRTNETSINAQQINKKKLSCFKINSKLSNRVNIKSGKIFIYFKAYCLVGLIIGLSKANFRNVQYYVIILKEAKEICLEAMFSIYVPLVYKIIIISFILFPNITTKIINILIAFKNNYKQKV